jgi:hypothetical protein
LFRCDGPRGTDAAVAATDDGHVSEKSFLPNLDARWAANNQAARDDWAFRAPHVLSVAANRIITTFYGSSPGAPTSPAAPTGVGRDCCSSSATRTISTASSPPLRAPT